MLIITPFNLALFIATAVITVVLSVSWFIIYFRRKSEHLKNVVYPAEGNGGICAFFSLFMCTLMIIMVCNKADAAYVPMAVDIIFWPFIIPSFYCVLKYDEEGFEYKDYIGRIHKCSFADVKGIRVCTSYDKRGRKISTQYKVFFNNSSLTVDVDFLAEKMFIETLKRGYEESVLRPLTISPTFGLKHDPMNGNVENPWAFVIGFIFCALLCLTYVGILVYEEFMLPMRRMSLNWELRQIIVVAMILLLLFGANFFIMCIIVNRNPERFSDRWFKIYKFKNRDKEK